MARLNLALGGPAPAAGNVAYEADDKALARLFEPCGVVKVRLHTDKDTGKPKGFAHVHFRWGRGPWAAGGCPAQPRSACRCRARAQQQQQQLAGAAHRRSRLDSLAGVQSAGRCRTVERLSRRARVMPHTCCPCLSRRDEAGLDQAVQLDGTSLLGRRIRVGYAQPKKEQPAQ